MFSQCWGTRSYGRVKPPNIMELEDNEDDGSGLELVHLADVLDYLGLIHSILILLHTMVMTEIDFICCIAWNSSYYRETLQLLLCWFLLPSSARLQQQRSLAGLRLAL